MKNIPFKNRLKHDIDYVKNLLSDKNYEPISHKLYCIYQVYQGHSCREVSKSKNVSSKQIANWVNQFENNGVEELFNQPRGPKHRLSQEQKEEIKQILKSNPSDYKGYKNVIWQKNILAEIIQERFGISYKDTQFNLLLKSIGFKNMNGIGILPIR